MNGKDMERKPSMADDVSKGNGKETVNEGDVWKGDGKETINGG